MEVSSSSRQLRRGDRILSDAIGTQGGTSFLKSGKDDSGVVHGVVAALRLQGRTMAIPWLSGLTAYSALAKKVGPFMRYAGERFVQRLQDGNPNGGKDFLWHLVNIFPLFSPFPQIQR